MSDEGTAINPIPIADGEFAAMVREARAARLARRDMFAAAALTGMLGNSDFNGTLEFFAAWARGYADALIAELDRTEPRP